MTGWYAKASPLRRNRRRPYRQTLVSPWFHGYISKFALNFCAARRNWPKCFSNQVLRHELAISPCGARSLRPGLRTRRLRRRLRGAHQGQEIACHRRAGPDDPEESQPPRRGGLGSEAFRRRRADDPDAGPVPARGDGQARREPAAVRPVRRRHGVPAARPGEPLRLRIRDRARDQGRGPGAARLARRAGGQCRPRRAGEEARTRHPPGLRRARRRRHGHRRAGAQALHHPQEFRACDPGAPAGARQGVLRAVDVGAPALLQGHAAGRPGRRVLPRSQGRARRVGAGAGAPALLDQHLPVVGPGAPVPHDLPQRRDQHGARQRQLDPRAPGRHLQPGAGRRPRQDLAADLPRPVGLGLLRQRARTAGDGRLFHRARGDDDDPGGLGEPHADGSQRGARSTNTTRR